MSRLRPLTPEELTSEQKKLIAAIASSPRPAPITGGPLLMWLRNPEGGERAQELGVFCRFGTSHSNEVLEVTVCTVARHFSQPYEWWAHKRNALLTKLDPAIIDAIENRVRPNFTDEKQEMAYLFAKELVETNVMSKPTYDRALNIFGEKALVELVQVIGFYSGLALQLNCFEILPEMGAAALKDSAVG